MEAQARRSDNKRTVSRRHLIYYLRVFDHKTGQLLGNLVDISTKGIMIVTDKLIPANVRYHLRMVLPDTVDGSKEVDFEAESRWSSNDINPDFFDTGFELLDPSMEFLDALDRLVEDCLFKE